MKENSAVELHQAQSGVLKKRDGRMRLFTHAGHALRLALDTFRHLFSLVKGPINKLFR